MTWCDQAPLNMAMLCGTVRSRGNCRSMAFERCGRNEIERGGFGMVYIAGVRVLCPRRMTERGGKTTGKGPGECQACGSSLC